MKGLREIEEFWAKVCFDPQYRPEGRFQTYRDLVFAGMMDVLQNICPVASGILTEEEWQRIFWEFLKESPPKSAILRQLPYECSQFLKSSPHALAQRYPYLGELMEYECLEILVRDAPDFELELKSGEFALNAASALGRYQWPVHFISEEYRDAEVLPRGNYFLFLWRDPESLDVRFMEVNPLVATLIEQLKPGPSVALELLDRIADQHQIEKSEAYLTEGQRLLSDLVAQGALISA